MSFLASLKDWLIDGYWPVTNPVEDSSDCVSEEQCSPSQLASGDVADIYVAPVVAGLAVPGAPFLLKIARRSEGSVHLENERQALQRLLRAAGPSTYRQYLPAFVRTSRTSEQVPKLVNVFRFEPGLHTLEQVHEQHPVLDARHLAWIFNRLLTVLGFCHREKVIHGAVLPCHALIDARSHGLKLVGWGQSVASGRPIRRVPARYREWYPPEVQLDRPAGPATDLFLAARCLVYLSGGDPLTNRTPEAVPSPMRQFIGTCLFDSPRMRSDDAWKLLEDFGSLLRALYGPPKFHELTMS